MWMTSEFAFDLIGPPTLQFVDDGLDRPASSLLAVPQSIDQLASVIVPGQPFTA